MMESYSDCFTEYDRVLINDNDMKMLLSSQRKRNPAFCTIESSQSGFYDKHESAQFNDMMTNKSRDNKYCDENEERSRTFQTLRESLLGAPSGCKDFSTVKKIREKIHFNLMNGTPSPLGKALVTLTTESSKDKMQLICIDDLNYNTDHEYRDTEDEGYIHQETICFAPGSELLSQASKDRSNTSDIKVKDYFKEDDEESCQSELLIQYRKDYDNVEKDCISKKSSHSSNNMQSSSAIEEPSK